MTTKGPVSDPDSIGKWPSVSVILVTKDHHADAEAAVASIMRSSYPNKSVEIIVIEETNLHRPIIGVSVKYHAIPVRNLGVGYARNQGVSKATGDVLAFTDDDCIVDKDWLKEIVRPLVEKSDAEATAGAVLVPECGVVGRCENILGFPGGGLKYLHAAGGKIVPMATFSTCNCAVRRSLKHARFRFHEGFVYAGEDELLSREISETSPVLYNPAAMVVHKPRDSYFGVFTWFMKRGQARVEMLRYQNYRRDLLVSTLYTSQFLRLLSIIGICMSTGIPVAVGLFVMFALYYLSVIWRHSWVLSCDNGWHTLAILPFVKAVMDAGMDAGIIRTVLAGRNSSGLLS